jgi:exodeoxyribonuclease VII large subunit
VIVLTRGGGSLEDLWCFNEELLARAVAASEIPMISAVGHEIDFTICDFVADLRVPTPSAAAELVVGRSEEYERLVADLRRRMGVAIELKLERLRRRFERVTNSPVFRDPLRLVRDRQQRVDDAVTRMSHAAALRLERAKRTLDTFESRLHALNPRGVLRRGYSILTEVRTGRIITSPGLPKGSEVSAMLAEGEMDLVVE